MVTQRGETLGSRGRDGLQEGGDGHEGIVVRQYLALRDILPGGIAQGEVYNGRPIALSDQLCGRGDVGPGGVVPGIIGLVELFLMAVFFIDEGGEILVFWCVFRYGHALHDARAEVVGSEVEQRQMAQRMEPRGQAEEGEQPPEEVLPPALRRKGEALPLPPAQQEGQEEEAEEDVFPESEPVAQLDGIAKASAVANGVGNDKPKRDDGHSNHECQRYLGHQSSANSQQDKHPKTELYGR